MTQDIRALFNLDKLEMNPAYAARLQLAQCIMIAAQKLETVVIQMPSEVAMEVARDLSFAAHFHPLGVPDDALPPHVQLPPSFFSRETDT